MTLAAITDPAMGVLGYERVEGDFYPTPPENLDCLAHYLDLSQLTVWEPACGKGHLSKRMAQLAGGVVSTDLFDRGFGTPGIDFLQCPHLPGALTASTRRPAIITNPPFGDVAEEFIRKALELTKPGTLGMQHPRGLVAMFLRNEYDMASTGRVDLFEGHPAFAMKICVTKRPRWIEGSKGSPRHSYAWYVWDWSHGSAFDIALIEAGQPTNVRPPAVRYIHPKNARPMVLS